MPTGERVADEARLRQLRATDPGALVIIEMLREDDPAELALLRRSFDLEGTIVASDSIPLMPTSAGFDPRQWPLARGVVTHPRTAGCFSRALRIWREEGRPLADAVRRCAFLPARVLEESCPAMRTKGRVQPGSDADMVIFDPAAITDQATYADSTRPSSGVRHLLVDGAFVIKDGALLPDARPGRLIVAGRHDGRREPLKAALG
jgi:Amidohydrolase family